MDAPPEALDGTARIFARQGASAYAEADTVEAFELAVKLGAGGIATAARATADGAAVLRERSRVGGRLRGRALSALTADDLPETVVTLPALYERLGVVPLLLEVPDEAAFDAVLGAARAAGDRAERELWLHVADLAQLVAWRTRTEARLVLSVAPRRVDRKPEQLAADLRSASIDGLLLYHQDWTGGLIALVHRFERYALGWGFEHDRELAKLLRSGLDAVSGRHPDRLSAAVGAFYPDDEPEAGS